MHKYSGSKISVGVVGGSGYSGLELCRILKNHPAVELKGTFGTKTVPELMKRAQEFSVVFLATPAEVSAELAPELLKQNIHVIDLSGAFRLASSEDYVKWYGFEHQSANLLAEASYGLVPWAKVPEGGPLLISNPGCYASAILMGLLPLLKFNLIQAETLVIDAKSGTTGAGKKASESQLFSEVDGECLPYKVGVHQHLPEISQMSQKFSGTKIDPFLTTHLLPTRRGIIAGLYARLAPNKTVADVEAAFKEFYLNYPFVSFHPEASLKKVVGTPNTNISFTVKEDKLYLFSCLDNLLKGAASQAVENFNLIHKLPVQTGLEFLEAIT